MKGGIADGRGGAEAELRIAVDATGIALWQWDIETDRLAWSEPMKVLHGMVTAPETSAVYFSELLHPEDRERVRRELRVAFSRGVMHTLSFRIVRPDGAIRWLLTLGSVQRNAEGKVERVLGGSIDVTEQRLLEEQLRHTQKLEAVGQLTAGIAHNFNNMLAAILPVLELARPHVPLARRQMLDDALHAGNRAAEMVRQLMTFAGGERDTSYTSQTIGPIAERALGMCRRLFDRRIAVGLRVDAGDAHVFCNAGQLEQAIVNVLLNARDAVLSEGTLRTPEIRLTVRMVDAASHPMLSAMQSVRRWVRLRVSDNGIGMSEEIRQRVFEPFFTTKGPHRGTGLGLATAYSILREHGGAITCDSQLGRGSAFDLYLPTAESVHEQARNAHDEPVPAAGGEKILVVDDEPSVREVTALMLENAGYIALRANGFHAAVELAGLHPDIRGVLLDRSMPGAKGLETVRALQTRLPHARVAYFTGQDPSAEERSGVDGVISKPVSYDELIRSVVELVR